MHEKCCAAAAFNERADRGPARSDDEVSLPMPGDGAIVGLGGTFAEDDIGGDVSLRFTS